MLDDLDQARELVAGAERYLEDQRQMIISLAGHEQDTTHAEALLQLMENVLTALREHLSSIERRLPAGTLTAPTTRAGAGPQKKRESRTGRRNS